MIISCGPVYVFDLVTAVNPDAEEGVCVSVWYSGLSDESSLMWLSGTEHFCGF